MSQRPTPFPTINHTVDICVVGAGMAGICAALAAARRGASVALMHDRPVLGGNASSECRVHIGGADRHNWHKNMRETGILEELRLDNLRVNPNKNFSVWDAVLFNKVRYQPNLSLFLNCSCVSAETRSGSILSVTGWQLTTQVYHTVQARIFVDCSGDAILAPLCGADFRMGREARHEFGESIAPLDADDRTMGMTCLFQARLYDSPQYFDPPSWARSYARCEDLPYGAKGHAWWQMGYWWVELGGTRHSILDAEALRDELLAIALGVWDHVKNRCPNRKAAENWALDWLQFLPAKRESRRYLGPHILTQLDIESEGRFPDLVAYGGWSMDDHHPAGFEAVKLGSPATIFHKAPSPYGIPYGSLYSRNVSNLMFAGRDASCTHAAMSSTRVMGTGCSMGQAVGTAAAIAVRRNLLPAQVAEHMPDLQQQLLADDAYLPGIPQEFAPLTLNAALSASQGDPSPVRDGINRPVGDDLHAWICSPGDFLTYSFESPLHVESLTLILDSALDQHTTMSYHQPDSQLTSPPGVCPRSFRIDVLVQGQWSMLSHVIDNHQRLVRIPVEREIDAARFTLESTWSAPTSRVFAFYLE